MAEKDSYWFKHDANARHDPKIISLRRKFGMEGYGVYFALIEILREQEDYRIPQSQLEAIAYDLHIETEKFNEMIDCCVESGLLLRDEEWVWSNSLNRRMQKLNDKREKRKKAVEERWKKVRKENTGDTKEEQTNTKDDTNVIQMNNKCNTHVEQNDTIREEQSRKEKSIVEKKRAGNTNPITLQIGFPAHDLYRWFYQYNPELKEYLNKDPTRAQRYINILTKTLHVARVEKIKSAMKKITDSEFH